MYKPFVREHMDKLAAAACAGAVLLSGAPAFADSTQRQTNNTTAGVYSQNITTTGRINADNMRANAQYVCYQLFTGNYYNALTEGAPEEGDVDLTSEGFGDIQFASSQMKTVILETLTEFGYPVTTTNRTEVQQAADTAKMIASIPAAKRRDFANDLVAAIQKAGLTATKTVTASASGTFELSGLTSGYYLVASDPRGAAYDGSINSTYDMTTGILTTVGSGTIQIHGKSSAVTVDKTVKDAKTDGAWDAAEGKVADAGLINNALVSLTYHLQGTVSSNIEDYDTYAYSFIDTLPVGLNVTDAELTTGVNSDNPAASSWEVKTYAVINDTKVEITLTPSITADTDASTGKPAYKITWSNADMKAELTKAFGANLPKNTTINDAVIHVEYTPKYDNTDIANMYGTVSSLTDPDINRVEVVYANNPYTNDQTGRTPQVANRVYDYNLEVTKVDENAASLAGAEFELQDASGKTVGKMIVDDSAAGKFTFTGLNADTEYTLTETKVPTGMTRIDPIKFTISADVDKKSGVVNKISTAFSSSLAGAVVHNGDGMCQMTTTDGSATVTAVVTNQKGPNMPLTGSSGMWGMVAVGGLLLGTSVYTLKKRQNA